ncbi:MAG: DegT/DnrJ/EryC1/StrS aminotransferase family protein [Candidatus Omnitrophica bacterium]|nr:DegT/DnrJ/EryC1/StrS aminotransferase family protein [Candidatus Omnitrophota bacterium]
MTMIPHSRPTLGPEEVQAAAEVIKSGHIAQGGKVCEFEEKLAEFIGVKGAVALNSGTSALHLGLLAMGVGPGDDVVVPSYVCSAPLNAAYLTGARAELSDIELESFNIGVENLEETGTEDTRAVIVPHMFGSPADLEKLVASDIPVVEDCAHSVGASYGNIKVGSIGVFSIISFYANKMMAAGEGGMLLSNDNDIIDFAKDLRDYDEKEEYKVRYNYKMSDLQAALGLVQFQKLPGMIERRRKIASRYDKAFKGLDVILPKGEFDHVYYRYVIRVKRDLSEALNQLEEKGVICAKPVYKPLHRYFEMRTGFRNSDEAYSSAISVPIYPSLTEEEQVRVIEAAKDVL